MRCERDAGANAPTLREAVLNSGMKPILHSGLQEAAEGITSIAEAIRVVPTGTTV